jgi:hypothetical protein
MTTNLQRSYTHSLLFTSVLNRQWSVSVRPKPHLLFIAHNSVTIQTCRLTVNAGKSVWTLKFRNSRHNYEQDKPSTCNLKLMGVHATITAVEKRKYYIFWERFCILRYWGWNVHPPCCHLWPLLFCYDFPHYPSSCTIFENKLTNLKSAFWTSLQLCLKHFSF